MDACEGGNAVINNNWVKAGIGLICVAALVLIVYVAMILDSRSPDPIWGVFQPKPTETTEATEAIDPTVVTLPGGETVPSQGNTQTQPDALEESVTLPEDKPASVIIPTEKDPETGENLGITYPCEVPEYGLVIEKLEPYSGMFVEDGTNAQAENVAMMLVTNNGDFPVEYTQICVDHGDEKLYFDISALPVGEKLVVQEKTGKAIPEEAASSATAMVVQRANMEMSESKVEVTDNGDNTLTIKNLTKDTIPTVRVFYKYYMEEEGIFVGGIAFTVRITRLAAGSSVTVQPAHYTSQTSRVVMVLTYDSEV